MWSTDDIYVTDKIETRRTRKWSIQVLNYINAMNLYIKNAGAKNSGRKL
jgi:hypothetical protein